MLPIRLANLYLPAVLLVAWMTPAPTVRAAAPALLPETNAAIAAFNRKDYQTAWRDFMAAAQKGDSEAQAGVGSMLLNHMNPPGTGYYAQAEKWLLMSAQQGNTKGMTWLGKFYHADGVNIAGGINPDINNAPIPPQLQAQAERSFVKARQWYERASALGDGYATGALAIMVDAGVGGPRDPARAAQLRAMVAHHADADFAKKINADAGTNAMMAAWHAGHRAEALQQATQGAAKGDAKAEALLGRAYYEGVGVPRNYSTALSYLNRAVEKNNADGMFFLGLMYEHGRGVPQDLAKAVALFDRAAALGQGFASLEVDGMRMQGEANKQAAERRRHMSSDDIACETAGGVSSPGACLRGGENIDPFDSTHNEAN
jgi:TPR repeat protein